MQAVVAHPPSDEEQLRVAALPVPRPGAGEVLVRVHAAAVSSLDIGILSGSMGVDLPFLIGSDVAGDVVVVGPAVTACSPGDRVLALSDSVGRTRPGGYADYVVVPAADLHPIPARVSFISSVSVGRAFSRAWTALLHDGRLGMNERVVVVGAAEPEGIAALQICRWRKCSVIAVSNGRHAQRLQALGATRVVSQSAPDLPDHVRVGLGKHGASLVFNVAGSALPDSLNMLERHGRLVVIGGANPQVFDVRRLVELRAHIIGCGAGGDAADLHHIHKLIGETAFLPVVDSIYPLSQAGRAHRRAASEAAFGTVVLVPDHLFRSGEQVGQLLEED